MFKEDQAKLSAPFTIKIDGAGETRNSLDDISSNGQHGNTAVLDFNGTTATKSCLVTVGRKACRQENNYE